MRRLKICLTGFGNVGQRFSRLLLDKKEWLKDRFDADIAVVGIAGRSKGCLVDPEGIDLEQALREVGATGRFAEDRRDIFGGTPVDMIRSCGADCFIEMSTLSVRDGEPAATYIRTAFEQGMHVITTNKGPEARYFRELAELARRAGKQFLFETIVMDGSPVFNLAEKTLHGCEISGICGILNGTSNYVLKLLESGLSYEQAIRKAQEIGLAEADPSMDMDGWDGAAKICALANILMDADITPEAVELESAAGITAEDIAAARAEGFCIKYICRAQRDPQNGRLKVSVKPERLSLDHAYSSVNGTSAAVTFFTDLAGELTLIQTDPGLLQTAYGVYSDLITLLKATQK